MINLIYPSSAELIEADQELLPLYVNDPISELFPDQNYDTAKVIWEQEDNYRGLMQIRGIGADFPSVPGVGLNRYEMSPGYYGEYAPVTEQEITERRAFGSFNAPVQITDLVMRREKLLMTRQFNRKAWIMWTLLATGEFYVSGPTGAILKRDAYLPQYYFAGTSWSDQANSSPLADLRAVQLLHRGHSINFNTSATAWMNLTTWNAFISNTNANDLGNRRQTGFQGPVGSVNAINELFTKDNLPNVRVHDAGYPSDGTDGFVKNTFQLFIPDYTVIVTGVRENGRKIGEFQMTRNASNPDGGPGLFAKVYDSAVTGDGRPPRQIEVYRGFNGGPALQYPASVVVMKV